LFIRSAISNIKLAIVIWLAGSTVVGFPAIYLSVGYKGMCIGYTVSAVIAALGKQKGIIFALSAMLLQNIIAVPCILALMVSSVKMYKSIIRKQNKESLKFEIYRHTIFSFIMIIGLILASFVEFLFTKSFFCDIIINFV